MACAKATLRRRRGGELVRAVAPVTVQVLGDIAQLRKIAECAGHRYGRVDAQAAER